MINAPRACESGVALRLPPQSQTRQLQWGDTFVESAMENEFKLRQEQNMPPRRGWGILWREWPKKISLLTELSDGARMWPQDQSQEVNGGEAVKMILTRQSV